MLNFSTAFSSFSVNDLGAAIQFYTEVLGLKVEKGDMYITLILSEENHVMVYPKPNHTPATYTALNFMVEDTEKAVDELTVKGVKFEQYDGVIKTDEKGISSGWGRKQAWFKDPAGNVFSIVQPTR